MKTITSNLLLFALFATVIAVVFRYLLSFGIENQLSYLYFSAPVFYGIAMFICGWFFGKRDWLKLPIYDVGLRFHLVTYIVHNAISEFWYLFGFNSSREKIEQIHWTAIIWGIVMLFHVVVFFWTRKNAINNIEKKDIFE